MGDFALMSLVEASMYTGTAHVDVGFTIDVIDFWFGHEGLAEQNKSEDKT